MVTDKILKGAGSHRILLTLVEGERTSRELKKMVNAVNGTARFELEYMGRLEVNGFVMKSGMLWSITVKGRHKCEELGDIKPKNIAGPRTYVGPSQEYRVEKPPPLRPGSFDFREFPSRRGNCLYYKDGRVEIVEE